MFRVLFLCTGNSARSQMAEALLNWKGKDRFEAYSAGSRPAAQVNPLAIATLREHGIPWAGHAPRGIDGLEHEPWDFVVTVCDRAKEACPIFPGRPFLDAFVLLSRRIDLLLALSLEKLERLALESRVRAIGDAGS